MESGGGEERNKEKREGGNERRVDGEKVELRGCEGEGDRKGNIPCSLSKPVNTRAEAGSSWQ